MAGENGRDDHGSTVLTLPSVARGHSDVPSVACLDDVVQGLHSFFNRRIVVKAVAC